jgi:hypothetical protein
LSANTGLFKKFIYKDKDYGVGRNYKIADIREMGMNGTMIFSDKSPNQLKISLIQT